jgi:hypothetical protein
MSLKARLAKRDTRQEPDKGTRESYIEQQVIKRAKKNGWLVRKLQWIGRNGAPDRFFAKGGVIIFVEFKQTGKEPRPDQAEEHQTMRNYGVHVIVIDNIESGYAVFS